MIATFSAALWLPLNIYPFLPTAKGLIAFSAPLSKSFDNLMENHNRVLALGRKNYLFAGCHDAAQNIAMFYRFFGTCKKLEIETQKWLKYVMENIHIIPAGNFKELLPQFTDKNLLQ